MLLSLRLKCICNFKVNLKVIDVVICDFYLITFYFILFLIEINLFVI